MKKTALELGMDAACYSAKMDCVVDEAEKMRLFDESYPLRRNLLLRRKLSHVKLAGIFPAWFTEKGVSNSG